MTVPTAAPSEAAAPAAKKGKKKLIIMVLGLVVVVAAVYLVVLPKLHKKPAPSKAGSAATPTATPSATPAPKPGPVLKEEPITINLAGGHYLRIGIALQLPLGVSETSVDGSQALNVAIEKLSGLDEQALQGHKRTTAVDSLNSAIVKAYGKTAVSSVYLTDFVMQ